MISVNLLNFNAATYVKNTVDFLENIDIISGLVKAGVFGFIVTLMGCYHGFQSRGGAEGVGAATTNAVVRPGSCRVRVTGSAASVTTVTAGVPGEAGGACSCSQAPRSISNGSRITRREIMSTMPYARRTGRIERRGKAGLRMIVHSLDVKQGPPRNLWPVSSLATRIGSRAERDTSAGRPPSL